MRRTLAISAAISLSVATIGFLVSQQHFNERISQKQAELAQVNRKRDYAWNKLMEANSTLAEGRTSRDHADIIRFLGRSDIASLREHEAILSLRQVVYSTIWAQEDVDGLSTAECARAEAKADSITNDGELLSLYVTNSFKAIEAANRLGI